MDIDNIKILVDAVKLKSFSKCAEKHSYTPSALSHIADSVEKELGLKILERDFSGVKLTKEGEQIYPLLEDLIAKTKSIKDLAKTLSSKQNRFTIGCYSSLANNLLPEMLVKFKESYPDIKVDVVVGDSVEDMKNKKAEIFFVSEQESDGREFIYVYSDKYVAVAQDKMFSGKKSLTLEDFNGYTFIMPNNSVVRSRFSNSSCDILDVISSDDISILSMVKNGLGVSVLPKLSVKNLAKGIKTLKLEPEIKRVLGIAIDSENKNPAVKKFIKFISK